MTFPGYVISEHHERVADHLTAVARGEIDRLMIELPPRHGKSELVSIRFPAWYLARNPHKHIIAASYAADLAHTFSRQARNLFEHPEWPFGASLAKDAQGVENWQTAVGGGYVSAGVGGAITGHGADLLLIDDPVKNREEADSQVVRDKQWEWYTSTARTRLHPGAAIVLCMTRWHEDDLGGRLLKAAQQGGEHWEVLRLPALAEADDPLGRAIGEPLWPLWFGTEALETIRRTVGSRNWNALYQQRPMADEGALFKRQWFRTVESAPPGLRWVRYWDLAVGVKKANDYTATAKCAFDKDGTLYIGDMARGRWEWPDAQALCRNYVDLDGRTCVVGIEDAGQQKGFLQYLQRDAAFRNVPLIGVNVHQDKQLRAAPWQARAEAGKVALVLGPWNSAFLDEVCTFPVGEHDDMVDAVSGAVQMLARSGSTVQTGSITVKR